MEQGGGRGGLICVALSAKSEGGIGDWGEGGREGGRGGDGRRWRRMRLSGERRGGKEEGNREARV
jgi:hypothetical protein